MIEMFNEVVTRPTGLIHESTFEQIKKMYLVDPDKAGELAISAIELILTDQISSDDVMIDMLLTPAQSVNTNNVVKYEQKVESSKQKKIKDMRLEEVAEMVKKGCKQQEIAVKLGMSQQNISYRISMIRAQFPFLLEQSESYKQNQVLQTELQTTYKNTNSTNGTNEDFCKNGEFVKSEEVKAEKHTFRF